MKDNLKTMLLTLGILASLKEEQLGAVREQFDVNVIEQEMERLADTLKENEDEFNVDMALSILGDLFPGAVRSSEPAETA